MVWRVMRTSFGDVSAPTASSTDPEDHETAVAETQIACSQRRRTDSRASAKAACEVLAFWRHLLHHAPPSATTIRIQRLVCKFSLQRLSNPHSLKAINKQGMGAKWESRRKRGRPLSWVAALNFGAPKLWTSLRASFGRTRKTT